MLVYQAKWEQNKVVSINKNKHCRQQKQQHSHYSQKRQYPSDFWTTNISESRKFICLNCCRRAEQIYQMRMMATKESGNEFQNPHA